MIRIGPRAVALIKHFESFRAEAYLCPAYRWTVGYGSTGKSIGPGTRWTQPQAEADLARRLGDEFGPQVVRALDGAPTAPAQFGALVSFTYNAGIGSLRRSLLLHAHREGRFGDCARRWLDTNTLNRMPGLVRRRAAEAALYRGDFPELTRLTKGEVQ